MLLFLWWSRFWLLFLFSCGLFGWFHFYSFFGLPFHSFLFIYLIHIFNGFNCIKAFCYVITVIFCRPTEEQIVRLNIYHGGMFIYQSFTLYINGPIEEEQWDWDVDTM